MITFSEECGGFRLSENCEWQRRSFDELMQPYIEAEESRPFVIARLHKDGKTICVQAIKLIDQLSKNVLSSYSQVDFVSIESNFVGLLQKKELGNYKRNWCRKITIPSDVQAYIVASLLENTERVYIARKQLIQNYFKQNDREQVRKWLHYTVCDFPQDRDSINRLVGIVEEDKSSRDFFLRKKLKELQSKFCESQNIVRPVFKSKVEPKKEALVTKSLFSKISQAFTCRLRNLPQKLASFRPKKSLCPSLSGLCSKLTTRIQGFFSAPKTNNKKNAKNLILLRLKQRKTPDDSRQPNETPLARDPEQANVQRVEDEKISAIFSKCVSFGSFILHYAIGEYAGLAPQVICMCCVSLFAQTNHALVKYQGSLLRGSALSLVCTLKIIELL
jgi:hypothetical protein